MTGKTNSNLTSVKLARRIFTEQLVPIAGAQDGGGYLPGGPDEKAESYFSVPDRPVLSLVELEAIDKCGEFAVLEALWRQGGQEELLVIIDHLKQLHQALTPDEVELGAEPSELIYALY